MVHSPPRGDALPASPVAGVGQLTVPLQYRHPGADRPAATGGRSEIRVRAASVMSRRQRWQFRIVLAGWFAACIFFWSWWLAADNVGSLPLFVLLSISLFYVGTFLSTMYLLFVGNMRRPVPVPVWQAEEAAPIGRVAVLSLTVPGSESWRSSGAS